MKLKSQMNIDVVNITRYLLLLPLPRFFQLLNS